MGTVGLNHSRPTHRLCWWSPLFLEISSYIYLQIDKMRLIIVSFLLVLLVISTTEATATCADACTTALTSCNTLAGSDETKKKSCTDLETKCKAACGGAAEVSMSLLLLGGSLMAVLAMAKQ